MLMKNLMMGALLGAANMFGGCGTDATDVASARQEIRCRLDDCPDIGHSCFEAETPILAEGPTGAWEWLPAFKVENGTRLASLDETSALTQPVLRARTVRTISHDPAVSDLRVLTFDNERQLKVTPNHPILLSDNRVVRADKLKVGDKLVNLDGSIARVSSIAIEATQRDVYNFVVDADEPMSHVIIAGNVLSPDLWWQERLTNAN